MTGRGLELVLAASEDDEGVVEGKGDVPAMHKHAHEMLYYSCATAIAAVQQKMNSDNSDSINQLITVYFV